MREIKFRAKCQQTGNIIYGYPVFYQDSCDFYVLQNVILDEDNNYSEHLPVKCFVEPKTVTQYTGIKDKSGVEIYDGDIVSLCEVWDRGDGFYDDALAVVEWCKEFNAYRTKEIGQDDWFYLCDHDLIVIGNIYETPELLND